MKVVWRKKNFKKHFLQLKKFYEKSLFTKSCLVFFSLGMVSALPSVSKIQGSVIPLQEVPLNTDIQTKDTTQERCYWQEDVAQFFTLQEKKKNAVQTEVPCEAKPPKTVVSSVEKKQSASNDTELDATIRELTDGYPIAVMADSIATYDREVAGLIVGIAKKESNWGKRVPVDESGKDCFNYWGYKGAGSRGVEMGHGCFGSPEEAVTAVGNRLQELVAIRETSLPADMIIWKCGSSCKGHSDESVRKWISDVALYYNQIVPRPVTYIQK